MLINNMNSNVTYQQKEIYQIILKRKACLLEIIFKKKDVNISMLIRNIFKILLFSHMMMMRINIESLKKKKHPFVWGRVPSSFFCKINDFSYSFNLYFHV